MIILDLNTADERPIYGQIADRVKFAVAGGALRPGDLVPSVRELSKQLVVNPNTVARAYRDLQTEGLLESVRGMGLAGGRGRGGALPGGASGDRAACGCAAPSRRRGRAGWTRRRSRPSSARSGPGRPAGQRRGREPRRERRSEAILDLDSEFNIQRSRSDGGGQAWHMQGR